VKDATKLLLLSVCQYALIAIVCSCLVMVCIVAIDRAQDGIVQSEHVFRDGVFLCGLLWLFMVLWHVGRKEKRKK